MKTHSGLEKGPDNKQRCWWCLGSADYLTYHDNDWGYPVADDFRLFENGLQPRAEWHCAAFARLTIDGLHAQRLAFQIDVLRPQAYQFASA